jgi:pilus assembly protein TadC
MRLALVALGVLGAWFAWPPRPDPGARVRRLLGPAAHAAPVRADSAVRRPFVAVAVLGMAGLVLVGGSAWIAVLAVPVALSAARRRAGGPVIDELPLVLDLVASCLAAGASPADAWQAAGVAAGRSLADDIGAVVAALRSGAPPSSAWAGWLADPRLAGVARTCLRTAESGAAAAAEVSRTASRLRARRGTEAQQRAARASVWIVLPLGLCFLPAFVLVGVVPLAVGLVQGLQ